MLQTIGPVELQKLGVVPQTVFLGSRIPPSETARRFSDRYSLSPRSTGDFPATPAPFEDLRRRLATINGSATSLSSGGGRDRLAPQRLPPAVQDLPPTVPMRPSSPTESVVSTTNSVSIRPRFSIGSVDIAKAAPAIGSIRTNAIGLLEAPGRGIVEGDRDPSGVTSPVSYATAARGARSPVPSVQEGRWRFTSFLSLTHSWKSRWS